MNTHSIRWNKGNTIRIVLFSEEFEKKLIEAHPQATRVFLSKFLDFLTDSTGNSHIVDYDQHDRILGFYRPEYGSDEALINEWIIRGVKITDGNLEDVLRCLSDIYAKLFD